ncbi:hypothetical protein [Phytomonospora endophytica]|uniref:Uncharacterized protein n=1 Tax=Phytomonospora endophytica TaxID=714109 RepID=A0A841FIL2_9ACTN|nr:hypothetical protein [Phytomonospora endophytica]MBB6036046.1 hypothetical protein [Phytomonospora endophytica]GIG66951.1 hypothetical protein Pen01_32460 [Phytomonospora endophytica]
MPSTSKRLLTLACALAAATALPAPAAAAAEIPRPLSWIQTDTPPSETPYSFGSVEAIADDDVWAAGGGRGTALAAHWDGTAWTTTPLPAELWYIDDIRARATDDVWALGTGPGGGHVMHWNGTAWADLPVPLPDPGEYGEVYMADLEPLANGDVWATGLVNREIKDERYSSGFTLHLTGGAWTLEELPIPDGATDVEYTGLAVTRSGTVYTTGVKYVPEPGTGWSTAEPWLQRRDAAQWTDLAFPALPGDLDPGHVGGVALDRRGRGFWIAGTAWTDDGTPRPYLRHYDGRGTWIDADLELDEGLGSDLAVSTAGDVLVVANRDPFGETGDVLIHFNGFFPIHYEAPENKDLATYLTADYIPRTDRLWLVGSTRQPSGREGTGLAAWSEVPGRSW